MDTDGAALAEVASCDQPVLVEGGSRWVPAAPARQVRAAGKLSGCLCRWCRSLWRWLSGPGALGWRLSGCWTPCQRAFVVLPVQSCHPAGQGNRRAIAGRCTVDRDLRLHRDGRLYRKHATAGGGVDTVTCTLLATGVSLPPPPPPQAVTRAAADNRDAVRKSAFSGVCMAAINGVGRRKIVLQSGRIPARIFVKHLWARCWAGSCTASARAVTAA